MLKKLNWNDALKLYSGKIFQDRCDELIYLKQISLPDIIYQWKELKDLLAVNFTCSWCQQTSLRSSYLCMFLELWRKVSFEYTHYKDKSCTSSRNNCAEVKPSRCSFWKHIIESHLTHLSLPRDVKTNIWPDFMILFHLIKNNSRKSKLFVRNGVDEFKKIFDPGCWNHCSGNETFSVAWTLGENLSIKYQELSWFGPSWIGKYENHWPQSMLISFKKPT